MKSFREAWFRSISVCNHYESVVPVLEEEVEGRLEIGADTPANLQGFPRLLHRKDVTLQSDVKLDYVDTLYSILEEPVDDREGLRHLAVIHGSAHIDGNQQPGCEVPLAAHILEAVAAARNHSGTAALAAQD